MSVRREGYNAYQEAKERSTNPYILEPYPSSYTEWDIGWDARRNNLYEEDWDDEDQDEDQFEEKDNP